MKRGILICLGAVMLIPSTVLALGQTQCTNIGTIAPLHPGLTARAPYVIPPRIGLSSHIFLRPWGKINSGIPAPTCQIGCTPNPKPPVVCPPKPCPPKPIPPKPIPPQPCPPRPCPPGGNVNISNVINTSITQTVIVNGRLS